MPDPARIVAIHGVPTSPALWGRLPFPVIAPALRGLATPEPRREWSLGGFVEEVLPSVGADTVLVGHDLGGVIAAMVALRVPVRRLVLSGTALGPYWAPVRLTARAPLHRYFYDRYGGTRFLRGGVTNGEDVVAAFPAVPELAARMRAIAREMTPPPGLAATLRGRVPVALVWGRRDRWYPPWVARAVARGTEGVLTWVDGGHLCMWENPAAYGEALRRVGV